MAHMGQADLHLIRDGRTRLNGLPGRWYSSRVALLALMGTIACSGAAPEIAQDPEPASIDSAAAQTVLAGNRLEGPVQIDFEWSLQEREGRFSGMGVTRVAPPDRARLDLFGPRGEGYLSAAFVEGEIRLPPGASPTTLPPPELLWTALGVFQPPGGATLVATRAEGTDLELDYTADGERWRYRFVGDRMRSVEWTSRAGGRRTVELDGDGELGLPGTAVYKDWRQFVELRLTLKEAFAVDGFSPDIWQVGQN